MHSAHYKPHITYTKDHTPCSASSKLILNNTLYPGRQNLSGGITMAVCVHAPPLDDRQTPHQVICSAHPHRASLIASPYQHRHKPAGNAAVVTCMDACMQCMHFLRMAGYARMAQSLLRHHSDQPSPLGLTPVGAIAVDVMMTSHRLQCLDSTLQTHKTASHIMPAAIDCTQSILRNSAPMTSPPPRRICYHTYHVAMVLPRCYRALLPRHCYHVVNALPCG